jgi:hypothetical protein
VTGSEAADREGKRYVEALLGSVFDHFDHGFDEEPDGTVPLADSGFNSLDSIVRKLRWPHGPDGSLAETK